MATPTNFVTRTQWGSKFDYSRNTLMPSTCKGVALHWTGPAQGTFTHDLCDNKVRGIEDYHINGKGWAGIAYNALVCPHGYIFEGRGSKYRSAANGDVTKNNNYYAVCYLGGQGDGFTDAAKVAFMRAVQWLRTTGAGAAVIGHRDVTSTECPGATIWAWLKATNFSSTSPTPTPTTAVWGQPDTWRIGSVGPDVTRLGQRLTLWAAYFGLPKPYQVGPGPEFTETDRKAVAAYQTAQGWTGAGADGYPGSETFTRLAADPPAPAPAPTSAVITSAIQNLAGNNPYGMKTGVTRTKRYVAARKATPVDVLNVQETTVASQVRPTLDSGLTGVMKRVGGGEGRYSYLGNRPKLIAAGMITVADQYEYNNDDKQASWCVYEVNGIRAMDVNMHLESDPGTTADNLRVKSALNIRNQALPIATKYAVKLGNICFCGDFNSEGMVIAALAPDWVNAAKGTEFEFKRTFIGWDNQASKRFDYFLVHKTCTNAKVVARSTDTSISDHAGLRLVRTITK